MEPVQERKPLSQNDEARIAAGFVVNAAGSPSGLIDLPVP